MAVDDSVGSQMKSKQATALVRIEVAVSLDQPWPEKATLEEVWKSAQREAEELMLATLSRNPGMHVRSMHTRAVEAVVTEDRKE